MFKRVSLSNDRNCRNRLTVWDGMRGQDRDDLLQIEYAGAAVRLDIDLTPEQASELVDALQAALQATRDREFSETE